MTYQQKRKIENELRNYEKYRLIAADYISSKCLEKMGIDCSNERVKSSSGNSVEKSVIKTIEEADILWKWCKVYENTYDCFRWTQKEKLMKMKYIDRNHRDCICGVLNISERTCDYWVTEILEKAFMWAREFKLL